VSDGNGCMAVGRGRHRLEGVGRDEERWNAFVIDGMACMAVGRGRLRWEGVNDGGDGYRAIGRGIGW